MRYILYCRKSTDTEDKQVLSLESQETELLELARSEGLEVIKILRESQSAKAEGRPIFASLLKELEAKKADGILCWKLDRLARNMADGGRLIDLLQKGAIKEIRTHESTHLPSDNVLMLSVQFGMANQYIIDLGTNVKRGNRTKLEQGGWPNRAPFGYRNDKATKTIVVDRKNKKVVIRSYELYTTGEYTIQAIVNQLYAEGFTSSRGTRFPKSKILSLLKNPFYSGLMYKNGKYYSGKHQAIISREMYDKAQEIMSEASRPKEKKHLFPLRGILLCASCTCMYTATAKKGHQYYYCTNGKGICEAHFRYMRSESAESLVASALGEIRFDEEIIEITYEAARERNKDKFAYTDAIRKRLQSQLDALERQELSAFEDSSSGLLRRELYERKMREIKASRSRLEYEVNTLKTKDAVLTLEPTKNVFDEGNKARELFLVAEPLEQQRIASKVLWNLLLKDGETQEIRYKSPYNILAKVPKNADLETMLGE